MSVIWPSAASMSRGASRRAASDFTTITDRVCPSRSCRSRENRIRSFSTARRANSSRAARSSRTASERERIAAVTIVDRNVPYAMLMASVPARTPETAPASAARPMPVLPSHGPRSTAPVARPSSGKKYSQLPP